MFELQVQVLGTSAARYQSYAEKKDIDREIDGKINRDIESDSTTATHRQTEREIHGVS